MGQQPWVSLSLEKRCTVGAETLGSQTPHRRAGPQTSADAGALQESQASAEVGGSEGAVSTKPDVSRAQAWRWDLGYRGFVPLHQHSAA